MNTQQQQTRPAILDEFRLPRTPEELRAKVQAKHFEGRFREPFEASDWVKKRLDALKAEYAQTRVGLREEILNGTSQEAALRRVAIKEEYEELKELRKELDYVTHPQKLEGYFISQDLERKTLEQRRQVQIGQGADRYGSIR